jgi:hypothetical protein
MHCFRVKVLFDVAAAGDGRRFRVRMVDADQVEAGFAHLAHRLEEARSGEVSRRASRLVEESEVTLDGVSMSGEKSDAFERAFVERVFDDPNPNGIRKDQRTLHRFAGF